MLLRLFYEVFRSSALGDVVAHLFGSKIMIYLRGIVMKLLLKPSYGLILATEM